jgi:hypothetical protein
MEERIMKKIFFLSIALMFVTVLFAQTYRAAKYMSPTDKLNERYCSPLFKTNDGTIFDLSNDYSAMGYPNILEWLNGRVAGLQIYHKRDGSPVAFIRNSKASIFLDEMPIEAGSLNLVSVADIAMIKVIKGPFVGAAGNGSGGTIAIYTFKGDDRDEEHSHS